VIVPTLPKNLTHNTKKPLPRHPFFWKTSTQWLLPSLPLPPPTPPSPPGPACRTRPSYHWWRGVRLVRFNSSARLQIVTSIVPPPSRKINQKSPYDNKATTPSPSRFSPNPAVLCFIVMLSALTTGRIVWFRPPGPKMKAITSPLPPTSIVDFPSWTPSHYAFPRPSEPTPRNTLIYCHVFEASNRAERSNLSSRSQFNDVLTA